MPQNRQQVQLSFAPVVKQVSPAVVNIYTKRTVSTAVNPFMSDPFFAPFFRQDLFGRQMRRQVESSLGSGLIVDAVGLVVTNAHVIKGAEEITVGLADGREFAADLALMDEASDLALLRVDAGGAVLPYARLRPSETLEVGDLVLAIGNPFGVGQTVTSGIVSALARSSLTINDFNFFIQTDAAINPGNSGGPLVALDGGVIGINTAIYSRSGGSLGIGFAIPSEMVATLLTAAKSGQSGAAGVIRPWLGATAQNVTSDIADSLNLERVGGALITRLHSASPLKKAGIRVGDVIVSLNGRPLRDASEMKFRMATVPLGERASVEILRAGESRSFNIVAMAPPEDPPRNETVLAGQQPLAGATVAQINPALSSELGILEEEGVVITDVNPRSRAAGFVNAGDIIVEVNGDDIEDIEELQDELEEYNDHIWTFIFRNQGRDRKIFIR